MLNWLFEVFCVGFTHRNHITKNTPREVMVTVRMKVAKKVVAITSASPRVAEEEFDILPVYRVKELSDTTL